MAIGSGEFERFDGNAERFWARTRMTEATTSDTKGGPHEYPQLYPPSIHG